MVDTLVGEGYTAYVLFVLICKINYMLPGLISTAFTTAVQNCNTSRLYQLSLELVSPVWGTMIL